MVAVARELSSRGHDVRWYTGKAFKQKVEGTGATHVPMEAGYDWGGKSREEAFPAHAGLTGPRSMIAAFRDIFIRTANGQMRDILSLLDSFPADVIVTGETMFGAGLAAEHRRIPTAWVATSIYTFSSRDTPPLGLGLHPMNSPLGRARNRLLRFMANSLIMRELRHEADHARDRAGLPRIPRGPFENIVHPPDLHLMGTVPSFEYPRSDMLPQTHFVGSFVTASQRDFEPPAWWEELSSGRPVVHVTQGTVANDADRLLGPALRALADEDALVVATTGAPPKSLRLGPLPSNVRLERFISHYHLLPHVDVMVTNGGYGGVNTALSHGVPLVVAPATEEKHEVAARVTWSGVGIQLRGAPSEADLRDAVRTVLGDPGYRRRARAIQDEYLALDAPARAAELIERLARQRRPGPLVA
jgi:MGT family glycosyltransferase